MTNSILSTGNPASRKQAELVLIPKPGKPDAYRPIRVLNTVAKGVESLINFRLQDSGLSRGQSFGRGENGSQMEILLNQDGDRTGLQSAHSVTVPDRSLTSSVARKQIQQRVSPLHRSRLLIAEILRFRDPNAAQV